MEWNLLNIICIFSYFNVFVKATDFGVCTEYKRIKHGNVYKNVIVRNCCNNFFRMNGTCLGCPIGHYSKGNNCTKCRHGQFGSKCAETCSCSRSERCDHRVGCVTSDVKPLKDNKIFIVLIIPIGILIIIILTYKYYQKNKQGNIASTNATSNLSADTVKKTVTTHKYDVQKEPHLYDDIFEGVQERNMAVRENVDQENEIINVSIQYHDTCDSFSEENESETENVTNQTSRDHGIDSISDNDNSVSGYSHSYEAINSKNIETHEYLSLETIETTDC